jgi:hypothetical protein
VLIDILALDSPGTLSVTRLSNTAGKLAYWASNARPGGYGFVKNHFPQQLRGRGDGTGKQ